MRGASSSIPIVVPARLFSSQISVISVTSALDRSGREALHDLLVEEGVDREGADHADGDGCEGGPVLDRSVLPCEVEQADLNRAEAAAGGERESDEQIVPQEEELHEPDREEGV